MFLVLWPLALVVLYIRTIDYYSNIYIKQNMTHLYNSRQTVSYPDHFDHLHFNMMMSSGGDVIISIEAKAESSPGTRLADRGFDNRS